MRSVYARPVARMWAVIALAGASLLLNGNIGRTDALEARLLAAHNRARAAAGVPPLRWDPALAASAAEWGRRLGRTNRLEHARVDRRDLKAPGENLWRGSRGYYSPEAMVGGWVAEKKDYRPGIFPGISLTGNHRDVGHYTQVMWRSTDRLGCAIAQSRQYEFLVCRYLEAGNVRGRRPF